MNPPITLTVLLSKCNQIVNLFQQNWAILRNITNIYNVKYYIDMELNVNLEIEVREY